jgi:hypothetical protein
MTDTTMVSRSNRQGWRSTLTVTLVSVLVALALAPDIYQPYADGVAYKALAEGRISEVYYYYAKRIAHPFVAGLVSHLCRIPTEAAFRCVAVVSLVAFLIAIHTFWSRFAPSLTPIVLPLAITPSLLLVYRDYYFQDLFHAVLVALFLLAMNQQSGGQAWIGVPLLLALHVTRESTTFLSATAAGLAYLAGRKRFAAALLLAGIAGTAAANWLGTFGIPNKHGVSEVMFLLGKASFNLLRSWFGIIGWTNTNADTLGCDPVWQLPAPPWLGSIKAVGVCRPDWRIPLQTVMQMTGAFGALPVVLLWLLRRHGWRQLRQQRLGTQIALLYGLLSWAMAPLLGTWIRRYVFYAWPSFLFGVPVLWHEARVRIRGVTLGLAFLILVSTWVPAALGSVGDPPGRWVGISVLVELGCWCAVWKLLRRLEANECAEPEQARSFC